MPSILIIDDEPNIRRMVGALLRAEGYEVREAATGSDAVSSIADDEPDVALLDLMMPGALDGVATLSKIREHWTDLPVVMMSGRASLSDAVRATKLGAVNFLEKPLSPETVLLALGSALELRQTRRTARALREELGLTGQMVGSSSVMARVGEIIDRVAPSDSRVLISGESGTGKELVAAAIHVKSPRRDRPFIRVNCAAIPRDLVESEMFGHEKGSFTGATATRIGRFELAHTGTLFLDEVGDLNVEAQAKLLRAIEAKEIQRVGGNRTIRVDVRVIAATNKALVRAVADGTFREDLYFRLNVIPITLPPLRERGNDIVELVHHFSLVQHQRTGHPLLHWSDDAVALMRSYPWPGNVRELANIVERIGIMSDGSLVRASDVHAVLPHHAPAVQQSGKESVTASGHAAQDYTVTDPATSHQEQGLTDVLDATERTLITTALARANGNIAEAARQLQTDRPNLYRRMKRLGIAGAVLLILVLHSLISPTRVIAQQPDSTAWRAPSPDSLHEVPQATVSDTISDTIHHVTQDTTQSTASDTLPRPLEVPGNASSMHPGITLTSGKVYNRVEGLPIVFGPSLVVERSAMSLDAGAYGIVRTEHDLRLNDPDAGYDAHVDVRLGSNQMFGVGGRLYDIVAPTQRWQITEPEAGLAAFLLRHDDLDYYGRHGGQVHADWYVNEKATLTAGYADEQWTSLTAQNPFTLFHENQHWRPNPLMDEGDVHLLTIDGTFDTRNDNRDPAGGWYLNGSYELGTSGKLTLASSNPQPLDGTATPPSVETDVQYGRVFFDLRRYNRISPRTQLNGRVVFGGWVQGDPLPLERKFSVGGIGTLPGYDFDHPVGSTDVQMCTAAGQLSPASPAQCDRVVLGQLEFRQQLTSAPFSITDAPPLRLRSAGFMALPVGVVFVDVGRGWRTTQPWPSNYKSDIGAGLDMGLIGVYVAKAVTDWSEPTNVFLRIQRRF